jgi:putative membrane protein
MEYIKNFIYGLLIGIANAIPGVSGGTMAVILNIYDRLMYAISLKNLGRNLKFLLPVLIGAGFGIFALSKVIVNAMEAYPIILNFCFIGLILGSIPALFKKAKGDKIHNRNWIFFALGLGVMVLLTIVNPDATANKSIAEFGGVSLWLCIWLAFTIMVSTIAMILPGLSGSLIMLLFGTYGAVMEAVATFNGVILLSLGVGIAAGGILGVKVIKNMLRFHPQALYFAILGLMIGSMIIIWPGFAMNAQGLIAVIGLLFFTAAAYVLASRK